VKSHKDLLVWQKSIEFVTLLYSITKSFPKEELYGLISQIRRAGISISSNIAEGAARFSKKEFIHYLYIALGSASELETQLIISKNLNYISVETYDSLLKNLTEIRMMLLGLIKSLKKK
jgi:four helix bundle protein